MELGIHGLHPDLIKLIGRLKYRTSFGQNALTHTAWKWLGWPVCWRARWASMSRWHAAPVCSMISARPLTMSSRAAMSRSVWTSAASTKENTQIIHAIEAHHGDVEPKTPLAFIIQACDAISAARPGARRENLENYMKRLEKLEEISSSFEGVEQAFAVQAGREVRIMVKPDVISDDQVILLARPSQRRSRTRWITPARSRSMSSARAAPSITQNKQSHFLGARCLWQRALLRALFSKTVRGTRTVMQ